MTSRKIALSQKILKHKQRRSRNGKLGAEARWSNHQPSEYDDIQRAYFDRKDSYYGTFTRFDGVTQNFRFSVNRKDQLDAYENGKSVGSFSRRNIGTLLFERV